MPTSKNAELMGGNFTGADLARTVFRDAILRGADFEQADLTRANFDGADLEDANLTGAVLDRARFSGANLKGAQGLNQFQLESACGDANTILPDDFALAPC